MIRRNRASGPAKAALVLLLLAGIPGLAWPQAAGRPAKPDLHAGGAQPSSIPNDATTEVTLPGSHLTGARIETNSICKLDSYQVLSDTEIKMKIKAMRKAGDKEGQCILTVRTAGGSSSTWVEVEWTDAQQATENAARENEDKQKADAFLNRAGKTWRLRFAGGSAETYTSAGPDADGMPTFSGSSGGSVRVAVATDGTVTILQAGCTRTGKLAGNEVKNGTSMGECSPAGSWTATVER
jgi:hypothetical protein